MRLATRLYGKRYAPFTALNNEYSVMARRLNTLRNTDPLPGCFLVLHESDAFHRHLKHASSIGSKQMVTLPHLISLSTGCDRTSRIQWPGVIVLVHRDDDFSLCVSFFQI